MNILYSVFTTGWGGLEKYPLTLNKTLKKNGNNQYIITHLNSKLYETANDMGIETFGLKSFSKFNFSVINTMRKIIKEKKIDVVHINSSRELYNWRFALMGFPKVKLIMTFHIGVPNHNELLHSFLYKRVNKIIAISHFEMEEMFTKLPANKSKICYLPNGIDLERFNNSKTENELLMAKKTLYKEYNIPMEHLLFTSVGNLSKGKGILEWINATINICIENKNITFIWIGDDSHIDENYTMEDLKNKIRDSGFSNRIILAGYQRDIPRFLEVSDLFLLPARKESFGLVYIEAMAMGLPVIGCNSGGPGEIIKDGVNGYLCEPNNVNSLKNSISRGIKNIAILKSIGKTNVEYSKIFSIESHVSKLIDIYSENN